MNKLYCIFFILLISNSISGQINVEANDLPNATTKFIDKKTKLPVNNDVWDEVEPFVNGYAKVAKNGKWGFVDGQGNLVIKNKFDATRNFEQNLAAVSQNNKWGFINEKGIQAIPFEYDIIYDFVVEITAGYKDNKWFLLTKDGKVIKPLAIDVFWGFKNGIAKISKEGQSGLMNINGDIISLEPKKNIAPLNFTPTISRPNAVQSAPCPPNIDFEFGNYTNWICYKGTVAVANIAGIPTNVITVTPNIPATTPTPGRHTLVPRVLPSAIDPLGLFPTNPPDGSNFALKLGNAINGKEAERVSYLMNIPAGSTDASITYRYAVVFEDPGHLVEEQPRFSAKLYIQNGNVSTPIECASYDYIADTLIAGFYTSPVNSTVRCKAWTSVFVNLSAYAGQTVRLEFTTADCTRGLHWGYAYVDVGDCNITANINYSCNPSTVSLQGPPGFEFYNWWNGNYSTLLSTTQNPVLTPAPALGSTIHVEVIPYNGSGCKDTLDVMVTNNNPAVDAGIDKTICLGDSIGIGTAAVAGNTYSWSPATYLSNPNIANPNASPPVTTTYYLTATNIANACSKIDSVVVIVNPTPNVVQTPDQMLCKGANSTAINFTGAVAGTTYNWTNSNPSIGLGASGTGNIPVFVATNNTNAQISGTITVTPTASGCPGPAKSFLIKVNPTPSVVQSSDQVLCNGSSTAAVSFSGVVAGATYNWTNSNPAIGLGASGNGNIPVFVATNNTNAQIAGTITVAPTASGCPGPAKTFLIKVNPTPAVTQSPDQVLCNGASTAAVSFSGTVAGTTYTWTNSNPSIGLGASGNGNIPVFVATNITNAQISGTITVTPTASSCPGPAKTFLIKVNPTPSVLQAPDQALCNGSSTATVSFSGAVAGATYNWTNSNPAIGLGASGNGNIPVFVATNNTNAQISGTITVAPTASGCPGPAKTFLIKVNPTPAVAQSPDQVLCNGASTAAVSFSGTVAGTTYTWTNSNPSIGLGASGNGNIPVFAANNNTNAQISGTITVTPTASGCPGPAKTLLIKVNPTPSVFQSSDQVLCNGSSTAAVSFSGVVAGATYNWTNSNPAIGLGASGNGNIPVFVATNNTNAQISGTITVAPTASGCPGPAKSFLIKVNPTPAVTQSPDQVLCNGASTAAVSFSSTVAGTTYTWTNSNPSIGLGASGNGNIPVFVATNNTNAQILGNITVTSTASSCPGPAKTFLIKVNPTPSVLQAPDQALCNGSSTAAVSFSGSVAGATYNWTNSNPAIGLGAFGTSNIPVFVATNNSNAQISGTITVAPTASGCPGPAKTFLIKVNPTPSVVQAPDQVLCNGSSTAAVSFSGAVAGTTYTWTNSNPAIGLGASGNGNIPVFVATNNTNAQISGTITVAPTASGCPGPAKTFLIKVNPTPAVAQSPDQVLCNGASTAAVSFSGTVAGTTYTWTNSNPSIGLGASGNGNIPVFVATNITNTQISGTITVTPTASSCPGPAKTFLIKVNPTPSVLQAPDQVLCNGSSTAAIAFNGAVAGATYNWTNSNPAVGLGATGSGNIPVFVATNSTDAQISGTITVAPTASGCPGPAKTFLIKVNPTPAVAQSPDQVLCNGSSTAAVSFSGTVAGTTYTWTNSNPTIGLGAIGSGNIPVFVATNSTNAQISGTVTVAATASGCPGPSKTFLIKINPTPSVTQTPDQVLCNGSSTAAVSFSGAVAGTSYNWTNSNTSIGLGVSGNGNIPVFVATNNTNAQISGTITVTPTATGCPGPVMSFLIKIDPTPLVVQLPDQELCANTNTAAINFSGNVIGAIYNWTNNNTSIGLVASGIGNIPAFMATNLTYSQTISTITVSANINGCAGPSKTLQIKVNPSVSIQTGNDIAICKWGQAPLYATGSQNFQWTPSTGLSCTHCANPIASPDTTTIYTVNAFPNTGCQNSDAIKVTVHQPIHINHAPNKQICAKETVNLWANGATTYLWSPSFGLNSNTSPNPIANVNQNTTYMVVGYDSHNCFKDTGYVSITMLPSPTIQLAADQTLSTGTLFPLTSTITNGPIVSWLWTPVTDLSCNTCPKPIATIKKDITYTVLVKNIFGCTATDEIRIHTMCEGSQVYIPNAFTPDGDGKNDILMVRSKGIELVRSFKIYSRWGELIFEKSNFPPNNAQYAWDGKIKGITGSAEVYVYIAEVTCDNLQNYIIKGNVSILK